MVDLMRVETCECPWEEWRVSLRLATPINQEKRRTVGAHNFASALNEQGNQCGCLQLRQHSHIVDPLLAKGDAC